MKFEIERSAGEGWREWIVVRATDYGVSMGVDYQSPDDPERKSWQDSGLCVDTEHLDRLIDALVQIRSAQRTTHARK